ncbi:hypothetical protein PHAVU_002G189900 [Phaseolus vulgaris]
MNMAATDHDHCMEFDQQFLVDDLDPFIEGFMDTTTCMSSPKSMMISPRNSSHNNTTSGHHLTPKASAFKPIRRRSRASKTTPITLLKANTSNFRALVQQFTGSSTTPMSLAIHKGPITLNFQQGTKQQIQHHTREATRLVPQFGTMISSNQVHQVSKPQQHLIMREQQSGYWLEHVKTSDLCLPTSGSCMDDGFGFDDDFSLHELSVNATSNDIQGFFM